MKNNFNKEKHKREENDFNKKSKKESKKEDLKEEITNEELIDKASNDNEILLLGNRVKELEEKLVRNQAELINYKKRMDTETSRMLKYCNEDIILDVISVLDNFERALKSSNTNQELIKYFEGFSIIYNNLKTILDKYEVKEIEAQDKEFDATYHQAVMTEHKDNVNSGIVIEVLQKGYTYKDKVIRHAMVKVSC